MTIRALLTLPQYFFIWEAGDVAGRGQRRGGKKDAGGSEVPAAPWCGDTAQCRPGPELLPLCSFLEALGTRVHPQALATQQRLARPAALAHGMAPVPEAGYLSC